MMKWLAVYALIGLLNFINCEIKNQRETMLGAQYYDGKKINVPISHEAGVEIRLKWENQGLSSLMSAVANQMLPEINEYHKNKLFKCSNEAEDVFQHARCIVEAMDSNDERKQYSSKTTKHMQKEEINLSKPSRYFPMNLTSQKTSAFLQEIPQRSWYVYRTKRETRKALSYKIKGTQFTPFGLIGKYLAGMSRTLNGKPKRKSWRSTMFDLRDLQSELRAAKEAKQNKIDMLKHSKFGISSLLDKNTPTGKRFMRRLRMPENVPSNFQSTISVEESRKAEIIKLFESATKLTMTLAGKNVSRLNRSFTLGSPRFFSLTPNTFDNNSSLLSPSLFSIHNEGKGIEKLTSLSSLMKLSDAEDYGPWLDLVMELSGVYDAAEKLKDANEGSKQRYFENFRKGIDGQPMYFTKENVTEMGGDFERRKIEAFENLTKSLTTGQHKSFNKTGYSILEASQLRLMYGPHSPFNNSEALNRLSSLDEGTINRYILLSIRELANYKADETYGRRQKRGAVVLSPKLLNVHVSDPDLNFAPLILSPILLNTLVFTPVILGPVILSPWLFVSVIISPRIMCPLIVSPAALSVLVLSPLIMDPLILTPAALVPFVLSPNVLSPNILSPSVLVPIILSPYILCPNVFSPGALDAVVLSPFAFSPALYSPLYSSIVYMSPHAFSPRFNSSTENTQIILSPSMFS